MSGDYGVGVIPLVNYSGGHRQTLISVVNYGGGHSPRQKNIVEVVN